MAGSNKGANNGLKVLIVFLVIAIIGLVTGVVAVNMRGDRVYVSGMTQEEAESFVEIANRAIEMPVDEAINYLYIQLKKHKESEEIWGQLMKVKVDVYEQAGMIDEAIAFLESLNIDNLDDLYKKAVYFKLYDLYDALEDEENASYYWKKYQDYEYYGYEW